MRFRLTICCAVLGFFLLGGLSWGQEKEKAPAPPAAVQTPAAPAPVEKPDPKQVVSQMCDFLKSLKEFSFKGEVTDEHTYSGGNKLQFAFAVAGYVKRPDKIRINAAGDRQNKEFIYDGKSITMYDTVKKVYASAPMPPTIDQALAKAHEEFGVKLTTAELANTALFDKITAGAQDQVYVGEGTVFGVTCRHVAFDKGTAEVQLWIEASDRPVLRKVVVTYKDVELSPQWTAYLTDWNVSPQLAESLFVFTPPQGAEKIDFMPMEKAKAPEKGKEKPKEKGGQK
jgi:hypothetical protein